METLKQILNFNSGMKKIDITPSISALMLEGNVHYNRPKNDKNKVRLSTQMKNGLWKEDVNSTIGFSKNNVLLDGQHRLEAIIHSGCTISMWVCNNVDEKSFDVIDSGKSRTPGDIFSINGIEKGNKVAASTMLLFTLNNKMSIHNNGSGKSNAAKDLTHHCLYKYYEYKEEYLGSIDYNSSVFGLANSISNGVHAYLLQFEEEEIVNDFFYKLKTGSDIYEGHPIMTFREQLIKFSSKSVKERPTKIEYIARLLKTFGFFNTRSEKPCKRIGWNEASKESFPYHKKHKKVDFTFYCK